MRMGHITRKNGKMSPTYSSYLAMLQRCYNTGAASYKKYGGVGITVCERWKGLSGFENFLFDLGERPEDKTLDRIDGSGNYEPLNCCWSTVIEQNNHTKKNVFLVLEGVRKTISEWSRTLGIKPATIQKRLYMGWSIEAALKTPVRNKKS